VTYIDVPIETEPVDLADEAYAYIEEKVPGWEASPGNLEAWLIESLSQIAGELRALTALVPESIFAYYGDSVLGLPPYTATQATGSTTWVAIDSAGYTVDAGTMVAITPPASLDSYAFEVVTAFTIPNGQTTAVTVEVRAIEAGAASSDITGAVELLDQLDFIDSVTLNAPTTGGEDAETPEDYLNRLSDLLTLLAPRPILPQDFSLLVQRTIPEIARATAIDLYNASTQTGNQARCVTVVIVDENGDPCSASVKNQALATLQSAREVNFLVFVADPTYTSIDVSFSVSSYPGYVTSDVVTRVTQAITDYLSPQNWGVPPYGDTSGRSWINDTTVRYLELAQIVNDVDGVHYVISLTFAKAGQTKGTADVVMTGIAPMPRPGAISGTATAET
jgi:Baseplate J-like protein